MKAQELQAIVMDKGLAHLPFLRQQVWFPLDEKGLPGPSGWIPTDAGPQCLPPSLWSIGKAPPGHLAFVVLAMFAGPDEIRVYASPAVMDGKTSPRRFTLSKHAPLIGSENMSQGTFQEEIIEELYVLAGVDPDELPPEEMEDCPHEAPGVQVFADGKWCSDCGAFFQGGKWTDPGEGPEPPEVGPLAPGATPPPPPPEVTAP